MFFTRVCAMATNLKLEFLRVNFCVMYFCLLLVLYGGNILVTPQKRIFATQMKCCLILHYIPKLVILLQ